MSNTRTAKLFRNGASQAVRLPADFRFEGSEVFATRDETTGDVTLSARPGASAWKAFFDLLHKAGAQDQFMAERPLNVDLPPAGVFDAEAPAKRR
jgi:antitoxin VapB